MVRQAQPPEHSSCTLLPPQPEHEPLPPLQFRGMQGCRATTTMAYLAGSCRVQQSGPRIGFAVAAAVAFGPRTSTEALRATIGDRERTPRAPETVSVAPRPTPLASSHSDHTRTTPSRAFVRHHMTRKHRATRLTEGQAPTIYARDPRVSTPIYACASLLQRGMRVTRGVC